jgi:hypothetical protein
VTRADEKRMDAGTYLPGDKVQIDVGPCSFHGTVEEACGDTIWVRWGSKLSPFRKGETCRPDRTAVRWWL